MRAPQVHSFPSARFRLAPALTQPGHLDYWAKDPVGTLSPRHPVPPSEAPTDGCPERRPARQEPKERGEGRGVDEDKRKKMTVGDDASFFYAFCYLQ